MVSAGEISYVSSINGDGDMTVTQDYHHHVESGIVDGDHRALQAIQAKKPIFVGTETNKPAGDFEQYSTKCELKNNGWGLFRPEVYDFKLMEYDDEGKAKEIDSAQKWDDCPEPNNSQSKGSLELKKRRSCRGPKT